MSRLSLDCTVPHPFVGTCPLTVRLCHVFCLCHVPPRLLLLVRLLFLASSPSALLPLPQLVLALVSPFRFPFCPRYLFRVANVDADVADCSPHMVPLSPEAQDILNRYNLTYDEVIFHESYHQIGKYVRLYCGSVNRKSKGTY